MKWAALWSVVCGMGAFGPAAWAQGGREPLGEAGMGGPRPVLLAAVQAPGFDIARLNHLFDAARLHLRTLSAPPPMPTAFPRNIPRAPAAPIVRPAPRRQTKAQVPAPQDLRAYRRTFRILLAHPEKTDRYDEAVSRAAQAYGLDPRLLKSIMAAESEFFWGALSPKGARGLMQVMPLTAEEFGVPRHRLWDPEANIRAGAAYLARLFKAAWRRFKLRGLSYERAPEWLKARVVAAYHAGPRMLWRSRWFKDTRAYVRKVMLFYRSRVTDFRRPTRAMSGSGEFPASHPLGPLP